MKGIIPIGKIRKKKEKEDREWREMDRKMEAFERAVAADAENHTAESAMRVLAAMGELNSTMANTPFGRQAAEERKKGMRISKKDIGKSLSVRRICRLLVSNISAGCC